VHDLDQRLEQIVGGFAEPIETQGVVERTRTRMARRRRRQHMKIGGALVAVVVGTTFGVAQLLPSADRTEDQLGTVDQTTLALAKTEWPAYVATLPPETVASPVIEYADDPMAVTGGRESVLRLYRFRQRAWTEIEHFETRLPFVIDRTGAARFAVADVTDDGEDDVLALDFIGADHVGGSILSGDGGRWRMLPFAEYGTYVTFLELETAETGGRLGSTVTNRTNDCTPDCATGTVYEDHWRFDSSKGEFVSVQREVWTPPDETNRTDR
jgi:hypothetical protein